MDGVTVIKQALYSFICNWWEDPDTHQVFLTDEMIYRFDFVPDFTPRPEVFND
jgi:hypothetical protein